MGDTRDSRRTSRASPVPGGVVFRVPVRPGAARGCPGGSPAASQGQTGRPIRIRDGTFGPGPFAPRQGARRPSTGCGSLPSGRRGLTARPGPVAPHRTGPTEGAPSRGIGRTPVARWGLEGWQQRDGEVRGRVPGRVEEVEQRNVSSHPSAGRSISCSGGAPCASCPSQADSPSGSPRRSLSRPPQAV